MKALQKQKRLSIDFIMFYGVLLLLSISCVQLNAQNIQQLEYFFGTDPGQGNGTLVTATTNTGELTQALALPTTGLDQGFQTLTVRAVDNLGAWSLYQAVTFYISEEFGGSNPISNIAGAEYWFDLDPGFGNGTALTISGSPAETTQGFVLPLGSLDEGFHSLGIRMQNLNGNWSLYEKNIFYVSEEFGGSDPISNIAGAEYWFDLDPGFGNGTALTISGSPAETTQGFVLPLGSLDEGFHSLGIRVQNLNGNWSLYEKNIFYVSEEIGGSDPISNLAALEYWFDTDPGFGNGTSIALTGSPSEANEALIIPLGTLEGGYHEIGIRAQNLDGEWSLYDRKRFFLIDAADFETPPTSPLDEIEFLYDAELGFGTGTSLAFTPTGNPDEYLVEIPTDMVTCDIHDIWISMKNADGNYSLYNILEEVDVFDNLNPTIVVFPDITVELDTNGEGSITLADVDNGTFDDCELVSVVLNQAQFDYSCADLGANTVTITATDAEAKVSTQNVTITVVDAINPVAIAQNLTLQLGANGTATITGDALDNGSTDNCSIVSRSVDMTSFGCEDLGANTVNFTVTDAGGNTNSVQATVTIEDSVVPDAIAQNITVQLDANGEASIVADDLDQSTDNCTIASKSIDITSFDCEDLGANTVTLTVTDQSGNSNTATATVTIEDAIAPNVIAQNITVQLDANGEATITADAIDNGSTDNCTIASRSLDILDFDCSDIGTNTVTLSVTDQSGVTGTATAVVTVEDSVNPIAIAQNITVQLDASGSVTVSATAVDNNSTDNCAIDLTSLDVSTFTCDDIGPNSVTFTVIDASGNENSTQATITVEDALAPNVVTQNITVQLDIDGVGAISVDDIDNGSTDNCGILSRSLDNSVFDCSSIGANTVILSVTDENGVIGTASAIVTVEDSIDPLAIGQDITVDLGGNPSVTILPEDLDNGSSDNCGSTTFSVNVDTFTAPGVYPVVLTVTDSAGNTDTVTVNVTVTNNTLDISDKEINPNAIRLYPNPTKDQLFFETDLSIERVQIIDLTGKKVIEINNPENSVFVQKLSEGVYFIQFNIENKIVTKRFIKQ